MLGFPVGTYLTVEGIRPETMRIKEASLNTIEVDTVNGRKLEKPVQIAIRNLWSHTLPQGERVVLRGYESGRMVGIPDEVLKIENVPGPQPSWSFDRYFVLTSCVQPRELPWRDTPGPLHHDLDIAAPSGCGTTDQMGSLESARAILQQMADKQKEAVQQATTRRARLEDFPGPFKGWGDAECRESTKSTPFQVILQGYRFNAKDNAPRAATISLVPTGRYSCLEVTVYSRPPPDDRQETRDRKKESELLMLIREWESDHK
jgi:hypothetical protein